MENGIADILSLALGVAISPVPIIAVILMLFSSRAKSNSLTFLVGWILGLGIVGLIAFYIASLQDFSPGNEPSTAASIIKLLLGVLFLFLAARQWRSRPKPGEEPEMPKWMETIDAFTAGKALGIALLLSAVNPKNLSLTLAAALSIAQAELSSAQSIIALGIYILIASITIAGPVIFYFVKGDKAAKTLDDLRSWLIENNATVMFVLLLILGIVLVGRGINGLLS